MPDGQKLKFKGLGHASDVFQGISGDLLITIKVKAHDYFKRDGLNIVTEVPVSITEAILGCNLTLDTLDGPLNIKLPPGTNTGSELKLQHLGMPPLNPSDKYDINKLRGD